MQDNKIDRQIVESARIFGQWLNQIAQVFAENEIAHDVSERENKICQVKAKILNEFENLAMKAVTPQEILFRLSRRAGQLVQTDVPNGATLFIDTVMSGEEISARNALQMIIIYMRLRNEEPNDFLPTQIETILRSEQSN
jgi:hypothetical protein